MEEHQLDVEQFSASNTTPNRRGRKPSVLTDHDQEVHLYHELYRLRVLGYNWKEISEATGLEIKFIRRWREKVDFQDPMNSLISDSDLDELVKSSIDGYAARGEKMVDSCLAEADCRVSRKRLRASMKRVDAAGIQSRKAKAIRRRQYNVQGPHHLWHVDGNHKLIKFNMVIHAGIDGFSRALMYARCSDNNTAETALVHFKEGVDNFGLPSRVRTDLGGENWGIARYMLEKRGYDRGSILAGKSTHNQRIERQWRDMTKEVTSFYRDLFFSLEEILQHQHNTSFSQPLPLYCLHFMFLPRINADLQRYLVRWNLHKLRTESNKCPARLLHENAIRSAAEQVDENYGSEFGEGDDEEVDYDHREIPSVVMNPVNCPLNQMQFSTMTNLYQPFTLNDPNTSLKDRFMEMYLFTASLM
jgi:hypothetical protein